MAILLQLMAATQIGRAFGTNKAGIQMSGDRHDNDQQGHNGGKNGKPAAQAVQELEFQGWLFLADFGNRTMSTQTSSTRLVIGIKTVSLNLAIAQGEAKIAFGWFLDRTLS